MTHLPNHSVYICTGRAASPALRCAALAPNLTCPSPTSRPALLQGIFPTKKTVGALEGVLPERKVGPRGQDLWGTRRR